jgi:hypothetical protein
MFVVSSNKVFTVTSSLRWNAPVVRGWWHRGRLTLRLHLPPRKKKRVNLQVDWAPVFFYCCKTKWCAESTKFSSPYYFKYSPYQKTFAIDIMHVNVFHILKLPGVIFWVSVQSAGFVRSSFMYVTCYNWQAQATIRPITLIPVKTKFKWNPSSSFGYETRGRTICRLQSKFMIFVGRPYTFRGPCLESNSCSSFHSQWLTTARISWWAKLFHN